MEKENNSKLSYIDCMMRLTGNVPFERMSDDDLDTIYYCAFGQKSYHMSRDGYIEKLTEKREAIRNNNNSTKY